MDPDVSTALDVITVIVVLVLIFLCIKKAMRTCRFYSIIAEKKFACPNCGLRFHVKWYKLLFNFQSLWDSAIIKCPGCGIKDQCKRTDESWHINL